MVKSRIILNLDLNTQCGVESIILLDPFVNVQIYLNKMGKWTNLATNALDQNSRWSEKGTKDAKSIAKKSLIVAKLPEIKHCM